MINLAISIGDTETIQLQILKLSPLKRDEKIQEIIHTLQSENYAQAQSLIVSYIETAPDEIHQRTVSEPPNTSEDDEALIKEFDLFRTKDEAEECDEINDIQNLERNSTDFYEADDKKKEQDFDALLNLKSEDVLPNALEMQQTLTQNDDFFSLPDESEPFAYTEVIEKDDFFLEENTEGDSLLKIPDTDTKEKHSANLETSDTETSTSYEPIPYIDQKFKNMQVQYPPVAQTDEHFASVDAWLKKIANEGYEERDIEEMMRYIEKLSSEKQGAQAAQLLLISAATQSKYAQFMLARALFKGQIIQKNLPEAFTLINRLAMEDDYAEAICDLGQFYEHGIGIDKDRQRAQALYKEAMELGIKRAKRHYERLKNNF